MGLRYRRGSGGGGSTATDRARWRLVCRRAWAFCHSAGNLFCASPFAFAQGEEALLRPEKSTTLDDRRC